MMYSLRAIFKDFYGVSLEIGKGLTIKADGMEKLPDDIRIGLEKWLEKNKGHVVERLKNEK